MNARRGFWGVCCAMMLASAFAACARAWEYHLVPETLSFKVNLDLAPYWDGVLAIRQITIDPCGLMSINDLSVTDRLGRRWFEVESAKVQFAASTDSPFRVTHIQVNHPSVTLWLDANGIGLPQGTENYSTDELLQYLDLREMTVNSGTLSIFNSDFAHTWNNIQFATLRSGDSNSYTVKLAFNNDGKNINFAGTADLQNKNFILGCRASYLADENETAGFVRILGISGIHHASGRIEADLSISGSLNDTEFWPVGTIDLSDISLFTEYGRIADKLESKIFLLGQRCVIKYLRADVAGGLLDASGYIKVPSDRPPSFGGKLKIEDADLKQLAAAIGKTKLPRQGKGSVVYDFNCADGRLASLRAHGLIFLNDADLWNAPVFSHLFRFWRFASSDPLTFSDVAAHFTMNGPVMTFQKAELASPLIAVEFESGSTIDLENQFVNGYANAIFLQKIGNMIAKIPLANLFINLKNKLTRVQIRGNWEQPASKLIRKDVVLDVKQGTVGFFRDAAKTGGQLQENAVNVFSSLFKASEKKL